MQAWKLLDAHITDIRDTIKTGVREDLTLGECKDCGGQLRVLRGKTGKRFVACVGKEGDEPRSRARGRAAAARLRPDVPAAAARHHHAHRQDRAASAAGRRSRSSAPAAAAARGCSASTSTARARRSTRRPQEGRAERERRVRRGGARKETTWRLPGVLITLEGCDGCGKSTQAALLCERLAACGLPVGHGRRARHGRPRAGRHAGRRGRPRRPAPRPVADRRRGPRRCCTRPRAPSSSETRAAARAARAGASWCSTASSTRRSPTRASPAASASTRSSPSTRPALQGLLPDLTLRHRRRPRRRPGARGGGEAPDRIEAEGLELPAARGRRLRRRGPPLPRPCPPRRRLPRRRRWWRPTSRRRPSRPSPPPACGWRAEAPCSTSSPGSARAKELFERAVRDDALSHAYLFAGPEGLGKTAFARELGVALVTSCGGCGACPECERARRGVHPDLHVVEREGDVIRIEQVEPVIADLSLQAVRRRPPRVGHPRGRAPQPGRRPTSCSRASRSRRPTSSSCSSPTALERVLPTIVSRCQLVEFRPLSDTEVERLPASSSYGLERRRGARRWRACPAASVEHAARLADDAVGPAAPRASTSATPRGRRAAARRRARPARAFIGVLARPQPGDRPARRRGRSPAASRELERSSRTSATSSGTRTRRRRAPSARRARLRPPGRAGRRRPARRPGCATSGWSPAGPPMYSGTATAPRELAAAVVATPDHYARLLGVAGRDAQGPVSQHRPEARAAGACSRASRRSPPVPRIASVVFRGGGKVYQFERRRPRVAPGDRVVVDTTRGHRLRTGRQGPRRGAGRAGPARASSRVRAQGYGRRPRGHRLAPRGRVRGQARVPRARGRAQARHEGRRGPPGVRRRQAHHHVLRRGAHRLPRALSARSTTGSAGASSSSRSALATSRASSAATAPAAAACAAPRSPATRSRSPSAWPRTRTCRSTRPRSPAAAAGSCAASSTSTRSTCRSASARPSAARSSRRPAGRAGSSSCSRPVDSVTVDLGEGRSATYKLAELGRADHAGGMTMADDTRRAQRTERVLQPLQDGDRGRRRSASTASARSTSTSPRRA